MNLEGLNVVISANISEFNNRMNDVTGQLHGMGGRFGTFAKVAGVALAGVATSVGLVAGALAKTGIGYNAMQEQSTVAWTTLLGSATEAEKMLKRISDFAKATPFETADVDIMAKYMHNAGLEGQNMFDALMKISDTASAFAIPASEAKEMARQMSQVRQAGVAYTEDLNILQDRGVPIYKAIAKQLGVTVADVKKMASEGKLTSDIYIKAFDSIANGVKGASDAQSKTFSGMISTMKDNLDILAGALSKPLFDAMKKGMEALMPVLEGLTAWAKGDFAGFSETMNKAFGSEMGGKITAVAKNISSGMGVISEWVGKGKQALKALFDMLTGDNLGAINIMTKMGLSSDMIASIINAFNTIKGYVSTFVDALIGYYKGLFSGDGNVGASFVRIFNVIKGIALPILQEVIAFIKEKLDMLKQFWDENGAQIMQAVKNFWSIIASIFEFIAPVILFIVKFLWDSVKGVIDGALKIIMGLIKIFAGIFTGDFGKMWEGIKQLFFGAIQFIWNLVNLMFVGNILKAIKAFGTGMVTFFKELGPKLIEFFKGMWDDAFKVFDDFWLAIKELWTIMRQHGESVFSSLWGVVKGIWETGVSIVKGIATGLKDAVVGIFNAIKGTSTGIFNGFKTVILGIWNGLKTGVGGVLNAIKTTVINIFNGVRNATSIWDAMKNVVMAIVNGLKSGATSAFNGLKTAIGGIFNGIKTAITTPIEGAKKIVLGIIDVIKGAFSKMNISIPKPKLPKVSVAMKKTSLGIPYPDFDVSWFAKGGVFNGASVIGVGEAGTEAVVPLQGHRMRPFAETIAKEMPNGGSTGGSGITQPIVIITQLDGREIARETVNPMESLMRGNRDSKLRARGGF